MKIKELRELTCFQERCILDIQHERDVLVMRLDRRIAELEAETARLRKWVEQRGCGPDCDVNYATDQWHCVCGRRKALEGE